MEGGIGVIQAVCRECSGSGFIEVENVSATGLPLEVPCPVCNGAYREQLRRAAERQLERTLVVREIQEDFDRAAADVVHWPLLDAEDRAAAREQLRDIAQRIWALADALGGAA